MALGNPFISDALAYVWTESRKFIPGLQLGGIYANKPWYHNTRQANQQKWPSNNYSITLPEDKLGSATLASAIDLTMSTLEMIKRTGYLRKAALDASDLRTKYIREFLGTTNGTTTSASLRHDSELGAFYGVAPDSTHLWHIHISFFRKYAASMEAAKAVVSVLKGETYAQYSGEEDLVTTQAEFNTFFLNAIKDPAIAAQLKAIPWQYSGRGIGDNDLTPEENISTLYALDTIYKHSRTPSSVVDVVSLAAAIVSALPPDATDLTVNEVKEAVKAALREGTV